MSITIGGNPTRKVTPIEKGNIVTDGSEQTILEFEGMGKVLGYIDVKNMKIGDKVTIRQYIKIRENDNYSKYAEEEYKDAQENPLIHIEPKEVDVALKVTIQQTAGFPNHFPNSFMREN